MNVPIWGDYMYIILAQISQATYYDCQLSFYDSNSFLI